MLQELLQKLEQELECLGSGGGASVCVDLDPGKVRIVGVREGTMPNPTDETASPSSRVCDEDLNRNAKTHERSHPCQQTPAGGTGDDPKVPNRKGSGRNF